MSGELTDTWAVNTEAAKVLVRNGYNASKVGPAKVKRYGGQYYMRIEFELVGQVIEAEAIKCG